MITSYFQYKRFIVLGIVAIALLFQNSYVYSEKRFFQTSNSQHTDFKRILKFAHYSNAAYESDQHIKQLAQNEGYAIAAIKTIDTAFVRFFVATNDTLNTHIIAIRGTSNIENALVDIDTQLITNPNLGIKLHRGFASAANLISKELSKIINKNYTVTLTGHSLGGAIAVILAMDLSTNGYKVSEVVTFGQPKVTNMLGARKFSGLNIHRVVSDTDVVPLVPPVNLLDLTKLDIYWHLGKEVVLFPGKYYSQLEGVKSMMRGLSFIYKTFTEEDLYAHQMQTYIKYINDKFPDHTIIPYDEHERVTTNARARGGYF